MGAERFRLDLDGVELADPRGRVACILRWRTQEGLIVRLPESTDVVIPWHLLEHASLDLAAGTVGLVFSAEANAQLTWLQGSRKLDGTWTDRAILARAPSTGT